MITKTESVLLLLLNKQKRDKINDHRKYWTIHPTSVIEKPINVDNWLLNFMPKLFQIFRFDGNFLSILCFFRRLPFFLIADFHFRRRSRRRFVHDDGVRRWDVFRRRRLALFGVGAFTFVNDFYDDGVVAVERKQRIGGAAGRRT
uniref:Transmembrane protein n=1 Tax=Romanomermis culicivorax TaxID=13658 RepID=A0A915JAN1_ROMCU